MICYTRRNQGATISHGFTLIELLVVIAVISVLLGILLPVLHRTRTLSKRISCQSNLRQIAMGWDLYLSDSDDLFYQNVNANHDFGGWRGNGTYNHHRPLNTYLNLPPDINSVAQAKVFHCPADSGGILGRPPTQQAFNYFGNSYQTNTLLIGPDQIGVPSDDSGPLHEQINRHLHQLKRMQVDNPSSLLLVGDNPWVNQWFSYMPHRPDWHGKEHFYNLAFLDGHIDFMHIRKGLYVTEEYNILPFKELSHLAYEVQEEVFGE